jgi:hypothetical protein
MVLDDFSFKVLSQPEDIRTIVPAKARRASLPVMAGAS